MSAAHESHKRGFVLDAVNHRDTGSIPYVIFFQPTIATRLAEYYGVQTIENVVDNSIEWINNTLPSAKLEESGILKNGEYTDDWGVRWHGVGETRGQVKTAPLSEPTLEGFNFPESLSPEITGQMKEQAEKNKHRYRVAKLGALWEQAVFLRGMENLLMDLVLQPAFVHELLDSILTVLLSNIETYHKNLDIDCIWLSDDYGAQRNLLMSPELWRMFIGPRVQRICDTVHDAGYHFALHSDGAIGDVIPDIVSIGVDILNPLQAECVDVHSVKQEFGKDITIWGGYGSQRNLVFGTPDDIHAEVHELCSNLGSGGGFILTPGLSIQNEVPIENAAAFIESAKEHEKG